MPPTSSSLQVSGTKDAGEFKGSRRTDWPEAKRAGRAVIDGPEEETNDLCVSH